MTTEMTPIETPPAIGTNTDGTLGSPPGLTIPHLLSFLLGRRESILAAARDRWTFYVGLILVIAAGLAREYDGEDLTRQPWHLLIPLAASIVVSLALFALVRRTDSPHRKPFFPEYRTFLGLFWLTAPMAALYGVPYERLLSPAGAVAANLWTLALVAAWRVLLIARVTSIVTGRSGWSSFFLVALVADVFAAAALIIVPLPLLQLMGGIRLTESETLLLNIGYLARAITLLSLLLWLIGGAVSRLNGATVPPPDLSHPPADVAKGCFILAAACVLAWTSALPFTQPEQRRRYDAERLLRSGEISAALAEMSRHAKSDYPPHWDPPPRLGWPQEEHPLVLDVMSVVATQQTAEWVRAIYLDKFERRWMGPYTYWQAADASAVMRLLEQLPEGRALRAEHADFLTRAVLTEETEFISATQAATRPATTRGFP